MEPVEPTTPRKPATKPAARRKPAAKPKRKPAPRKRGPARRSDWQEKFLAALANFGLISASCELAGVSDESVRRERARSADFDHQCRQAIDKSVDNVELRLREYAMVGVKKRRITTVDGKVVQDVELTEPSVAAITFFLKAHRPEKYRETIRTETTGADGGPVLLDVTNLEADVAVDRFSAEVVRLADARAARESAQSSSTG